MDSGASSSLETLGHAPAPRCPMHPRNVGEEPEEALDPLPQGIPRALLPTGMDSHRLPGSAGGAQSARTLSPPLPWSWAPRTSSSLNQQNCSKPASSQPSELCSPGVGSPSPRGSASWSPSAPVLRLLPPGVQVGHGAVSQGAGPTPPQSWGESQGQRGHIWGPRAASSLPQAGTAAGKGGCLSQ